MIINKLSIYFISIFSIVQVHSIVSQEYSDSISINLFLLDECRISQKMSSYINDIYTDYQDENQFYFQAYFPNKSTSTIKASEFMKEYNINIPYKMDHEKDRSKVLGATTLPQVIIKDEKYQSIIYSGRINNLFNRIGSRRRVITSHDLVDALQSIKHERTIENPNTKSIGCIINYNENLK